MTKIVSILQFAEMLGVSRDTIERMIKQGKLKAVRKNPLAGRTSPLLIPASEVERVKKLMQANSHEKVFVPVMGKNASGGLKRD